MSRPITLVGLDVGEKRIGVSIGDNSVRLAVPYETIEVDGKEIDAIANIAIKQNVDIIVVGYPRNQSGETTAQTAFVEEFASRLLYIAPKIVFQDESLTSVMAERRLIDHKKPYTKADIDAQAAAIILQDYIEANYA